VGARSAESASTSPGGGWGLGESPGAASPGAETPNSPGGWLPAPDAREEPGLPPPAVVVARILVVGGPGCGKTELVRAFSGEPPALRHEPTVGLERSRCRVHLARGLGRGDVCVHVIDCGAGACRRPGALAPRLYRGAHAVVVVYDAASAESFERARLHLDSAARHGRAGTTRLLFANAAGVETDAQTRARQKVPRAEGEALAREAGALFAEGSATDAEAAKAAFGAAVMEQLVRLALRDDEWSGESAELRPRGRSLEDAGTDGCAIQ
jgi:hypothetical protein